MPKVSPTASETSDNSSSTGLLFKMEEPQEVVDHNGSPVVTTSFSSAEYTNKGLESVANDTNSQTLSQLVTNLSFTQDPRVETIDFGEQNIHQLARDGNVYIMKAMLDRITHPSAVKKKLNQKDRDKFTPLHYAARYNHFEMCELLMQKGAYLHARGEDQMTPLHLVAKYKPKKEKIYGSGDGDKSNISEEDSAEQQEANLKILDYLVDAGARVNERDFYGLTPLHHACLRGNVGCVERLLRRRGIAIEAADKQEMTPLHICSVYGHVDVAKLLIDRGANIRCKDDDNGTPLQFAAAEGYLEIVKLIFNQCHQPNSQLLLRDLLDEKDNDGNAPLHLAVDNGHLHVTNYIIDQCIALNYTAGLNEQRADRETPLHVAAKRGHLDIVQLLVERGAKINARNGSLQTPLFFASQNNHDQVVEFLLSRGANIELHDTDNYTALLIAASYGHTETMEVLLKNKANVLATEKNDKNVLYLCAEENRADALQLLFESKKVRSLLEGTDRYDNTPLHVAALNGNFGAVKTLLDNGAVVDSKNDDEQTPLHLAAQNGSVKIVKELINRKKDIVQDDDEVGNTPLHLAALSGREHCIRELVRLGADTAARNAKQWTALDCCAYAGMTKSALVLLEADAPVDAKDKRKQTPLHLACIHGHRKMVELLLNWGADVTHRAVSGNNALDWAIKFGQVECASAIIESDRWQEALQNRTRDHKFEQLVDTPMRKLIRRMPGVASQVFQKCLEDNGKSSDDFKYEITFDYEFLDDEFSCKNWIDSDDMTSEVNVAVPDNALPSPVTPGNEVFDDNGKLLPAALPYSTDSSLLMKNHPLYIMVKHERVHLLRHPLVVSLLNHKWRAYGRLVYYLNLIIYVVFMGILNSYILTIPPPYAVNYTATNPSGPCAEILQDAQAVWGVGCRFPTEWQPIASIIIIVLAAVNLLKELYQILSKRFSYVRSLTNFIELAVYILSILLVIDVTEIGRNSGIREPWQWQCGAAAIFLSWMGLLLFIQSFPQFGIFVLMFGDVLWTFVSFFAVFALFILGFAFSFHVLLQNQFAFNFWWNSIVKTFVMMIGEFEYDGIFNSEATDPSYTSLLQYEGITYVLFVIFMIIMSIIIMNLLVGLAVDDIKQVQDNAELEGLAMQVKLALDIEYTLPRWLRRKFMRKTRKFKPNRLRKENAFARWLHSEQHLNHDTIEEALNPEKSDLQNMEEKLNTLSAKVRDLRTTIYTMNDRTKQVENITQALADHFKVDYDNNEDDLDSR